MQKGPIVTKETKASSHPENSKKCVCHNCIKCQCHKTCRQT